MGWLADFFRLFGGLLYWNARKTLHRLRGSPGVCPCRHPSDSGRAWETGCHAVVHWNSPARFRRLCPLLRQDAAGRWRCSVNADGVRPFWGRALAFYGAGLAILYLAGTLAAFTALRATGYRVTYAGVAWPPAWKKFDGVKSDLFYAKFQRAYARQDIREALLDLSLAYDLNPGNYDAGLLFARLTQIGQPALSDRIYRRLLADHPAQAGQTAQAFFRALLARGDFPAVQTLARERLLAAPDAASAWLNAFLFANRRTGDDGALASLARDPRLRDLPPDARTVLSLAVDLRASTPADAREKLIASAERGATGYALYFICRQLTERGEPRIALGLTDRPDTRLNARDREVLRLDTLAVQGWDSALDNEVTLLLIPPPTPAVVQLLGDHLIRHPDTRLLGRLCARLEQSPLPSDEKSYAAFLALFCAAGSARDEARLEWSAARLREILGARFTSLQSVGEFLLGKRKAGHLGNYLPALNPLPLETTYALLDRYEPAPPAPPPPGALK